MKILLIFDSEPGDYKNFNLTKLIRLLSTEHIVKTAWWIINDDNLINSNLDKKIRDVVISATDFKSFNPNVIIYDGIPRKSKKIPENVENQFIENGGSIIFINIIPNSNSDNDLFAKYNISFALSKRDNEPVYLSQPGINSDEILIKKWKSPFKTKDNKDVILDLFFVHCYIINCGFGHHWIDVPNHYRGKDPAWLVDDDINTNRPFSISWCGFTPNPVFVITGYMLIDNYIDKVDNSLFIMHILEIINSYNEKREFISQTMFNKHDNEVNSSKNNLNQLDEIKLKSENIQNQIINIINVTGNNNIIGQNLDKSNLNVDIENNDN